LIQLIHAHVSNHTTPSSASFNTNISASNVACLTTPENASHAPAPNISRATASVSPIPTPATASGIAPAPDS
ncbi:hypothetical protein U1Q18_036734, partial [Sarracenia purpurea var. burkii]